MPDLHHTVVRILAKSQTDNDNEALTAIRLANQLLAKHNKTWYHVVPEHTPPPKPNGHDKPNDHADKYDHSGIDWAQRIDAILDVNPGMSNRGREFLMSVREFFKKYRRLTVKQAAAVKKFM